MSRKWGKPFSSSSKYTATPLLLAASKRSCRINRSVNRSMTTATNWKPSKAYQWVYWAIIHFYPRRFCTAGLSLNEHVQSYTSGQVKKKSRYKSAQTHWRQADLQAQTNQWKQTWHECESCSAMKNAKDYSSKNGLIKTRNCFLLTCQKFEVLSLSNLQLLVTHAVHANFYNNSNLFRVNQQA